MTYWTIMVITILSGPMNGAQMNLLFNSPDTCEAARSAVSEVLADSYDHNLECVVSDMVVRP